MSDQAELLQKFILSAQHILVVQADNPDADSLGSALALEQALAEQDKKVSLFCGVSMPTYLHYLSGWSRVGADISNDVDLVIIVDAATNTLIEKFRSHKSFSKFTPDQLVVVDHHENVQDVIDAGLIITNTEVSSTGELLYQLMDLMHWKISKETAECLMTAILGDTQGLSNSLASANTFRVVAQLIDFGADRVQLEEKRREHNKLADVIYRYKARLIERTELLDGDQIAWVVVPHSEIRQYSPLYNPAALIHPDMLQIEHVRVGIVFKTYDDGKVTAAIKCNNNAPIAAAIALKFGGGGHNYASGFKITDGRTIKTIQQECLEELTKLLEQ